MAVDKEAGRLVEKRDLAYILILLAIALGIGTYLIVTTVLIAKDGVIYIERAKQFSSNPIGTIKAQPPGYPFLIFIAHKYAALFSNGSSAQSWIYSAQSITLLCRVLSLIPLYFIGKLLVGPRRSFWGLLILIMLPYPAEFGSDVIREWPHILFLSTGLLFLMWASKFGKWWMFVVAGFTAGLGHTIRAECAQIVIYAILWLLISLFLPKQNMSRPKAVFLTLILLLGFAAPAAPYLKVKGTVLPTKLKRLINYNTLRQADGVKKNGLDDTAAGYTASGLPADILKALGKLVQQISENLMHFFILPLMVGLYHHFGKLRKVLLTEKLFIFALIVLYAVMMVLLHINYGYISRRHCMPMVVFTVFYVVVGLQLIAYWLNRRMSKNNLIAHRNRRRWFFVLAAVGLSVCIAKFVRITPLRLEKQGYKEAAEWLKKNTDLEDIIAVPDRRIAFYAERKGLIYDKNIPEQAKYVVRIVGSEDEKPGIGKDIKEEYSTWINNHKKSGTLVIYKVIR